jgi:hypothetical protein
MTSRLRLSDEEINRRMEEQALGRQRAEQWALRDAATSSPVEYGDYVSRQTRTFSTQLPNMVPIITQNAKLPVDILNQSKFSMAAWDPNTRSTSLRDIDLASYATPLETSKEITDYQNKCKSNSLDNLINTESPFAKFRCGWIYQKGSPGYNPKVSVGNVGTSSGPIQFENTPSGTWYWNLEDAKKQILADRCNSLTSCEDVGGPSYQNCAYSTTKGVGVPVKSNGSLMYPNDEKLTAPPRSLVTTAGACPRPPAPGTPEYEVARSRDVCLPLENGKLSRDCMLQQITAAGCKTDGALYKALTNSATPQNYAAGLENYAAFRKYQQLASPPLRDEVIRSATASKNMALNDFRQLAAKIDGPYSELRFAAQDLCTKVGTFDTYDFCMEIQDGNSPPFPLICLQRKFRELGGQPAGTEYPSQQNISAWNSLSSWRDVITRIEDLKNKTNSKDQKVQADALQKFLGISPDSLRGSQIPRINGLETFWFNRAINGFIGRRVEPNGKFPEGWGWGEVERMKTGDMIEYLAMTNIRPPTDQNVRLRVETDDGMIATLNTNKVLKDARGRYASTSDEFSLNWDQAPTSHTANTCWQLKKNGPNYVNIWWQETYGIAWSQVYMAPCNGGSWQRFPPEWFTMTQEPDAPMLSFQVVRSEFIERRMPSFFPVLASQFGINSETKDFVVNDSSAIATINRLILINSARTITCRFKTTPNSKGLLLDLGGTLRVVLDGPNITFAWNGRALTGTSHTFRGALNTSGEYNYIYINWRADYKYRFPNRITFAAGPQSEFLNSNINVQSMSNSVVSFTSENNIPLYDPRNDYAQFKIGAIGASPRGVAIKNIRFFDYEMLNEQIVKDINDGWEMEFPFS